MKIRQLKKKFNKKGLHHTQIWRDSNFAIYRQTVDIPYSDEIFTTSFEVIKIKLVEPNPKYDTGEFDMVESYPSVSEWGRLGFTCSTLERAKEKIKELR